MPSEFRGHRDLEYLWNTDPEFRSAWETLQAFHADYAEQAPEPAPEAITAPLDASAATGWSGPRENAADGRTAPLPVSEWQRVEAEARIRMEAEGEDAWAAGIAVVRAAGARTTVRVRTPYVPTLQR